jgi:hypothetical protein
MRGARKPNPFGWRSAAAAKHETQSSRVRDSTSSYIGFCELDRGGRTVRKRLGVRSPSAGGNGFGVALEQCVRARVGAEGDGSDSDRERRTAAALLETCEASWRVMGIIL